MLATGSPLHAFDPAPRRGSSLAAPPRRGAADARRRAPPPRCCRHGHRRCSEPVAIAGMGGEQSEVRAETSDAACFDAVTSGPAHVAPPAPAQRVLDRGEKGVDPYAAEAAADYATQLLVDGRARPMCTRACPRPVVQSAPSSPTGSPGCPSRRTSSARRLGRIGFDVGDGGTVTVPMRRALQRPPRRGGRPLPHGGGAGEAAERQAMFGQLTREQRLLRTCWWAPATTRPTRGASCRGATEPPASGAAVERAGRSAPGPPARAASL